MKRTITITLEVDATEYHEIAHCTGIGTFEGKVCPACEGMGRTIAHRGQFVLIPRPSPVTLTREQCEQLLANNSMHGHRHAPRRL